jgi:hypothetical protein
MNSYPRRTALLGITLIALWSGINCFGEFIVPPGCNPGPPPNGCLSGRGVWISTPKLSTTAAWEDLMPDWSLEERNYWNAYWTALYPIAWRFGDSTRTFNCHSYSVYSVVHWLNPVQFNPFIADGSYVYALNGYGLPTSQQIAILNSLRNTYGTVIIVNGINDHSGRYVGGGYVYSKWGSCGLYHHPIGYGPYTLIWKAFYKAP